MVDFSRDFWIRETGTGQQVAQLHDGYDDDDDDDDNDDVTGLLSNLGKTLSSLIHTWSSKIHRHFFGIARAPPRALEGARASFTVNPPLIYGVSYKPQSSLTNTARELQ